MQESRVLPLGKGDPAEQEMATQSSILAWEIPWTEKPGRLQSWGHRESDMIEHTHTPKRQKSLVFENVVISDNEILFFLCCTVCGILVPPTGIKPVPLKWKHRVLTTGLPGQS